MADSTAMTPPLLLALVCGLVGRRFFQHPVGYFSLDARVPDANAQAPVIGRTELGMNIPQAVVPGMAAPALEFHLAGGDVQFIVRHQDFLGLDLEEPRQ